MSGPFPSATPYPSLPFWFPLMFFLHNNHRPMGPREHQPSSQFCLQTHFKKGNFLQVQNNLEKKKKAGLASSCGNTDDNLMNTNCSNQQAISGGVCRAAGCGCCISSLGSLLTFSWKQNTTLPCPHPSREADLQ